MKKKKFTAELSSLDATELIGEKLIWSLCRELDVFLANLIRENEKIITRLLGDSPSESVNDIFDIQLRDEMHRFQNYVDLALYFGSYGIAEMMIGTKLCETNMNPHWMCILADKKNFSTIEKLFQKYSSIVLTIEGTPTF